jgi:hypothetical protein
MPFLSNIPSKRFSQRYVDAARFVNVAAEKVDWLLPIDEFFDRAAAVVFAFAGLVKLGIFGRAMTNQN